MDTLDSARDASTFSKIPEGRPAEPSSLAAGLSKPRIALILAGVMLSLLLAAMDMTIVATALPRIVADLGGLSQISWVVTAYLVMSTILVPVVGRMSDIYGRKPMFIIGILVFVVGSILSGISQNMLELILFRGIQGGGAAFIMANTFTVVGDVFPPAERGKWQGLIGAVFGISSIAGPLTGGYLTDNLSWRWIFYVNLPIGLVALAALLFAMPAFGNRKGRHAVDYPGAAALVLALIPLLMALSVGGDTYAWASVQIVGLFVFSAVMFAIFISIEKRAAQPILPLSLFKNPIFVVASSATFLTGMGMFGAILFIPLFVQGVIGRSATNSGLVLTPMMLGAVFSSAVGGQLLSRWSRYRFIALAGVMLMTAGMSLLALMGRSTSNAEVTRNMVLVGLGLGTTFPLFTIVVQNAFPYGLMGLVTASVQFFRSIGGALGVSIMGSLMASRLSSGIMSSLSQESQDEIGPALMEQIQDANVLVNSDALHILELQFLQLGDRGPELFQAALEAMRGALTSSLHDVFVVGAIIVGLTILLLLFLKEIPLRKAHDFHQAEPSDAPYKGKLKPATKRPPP